MAEEKDKYLMVTIQCITYNHEPYIRQCLDGFLMQKTNFCFEAIVHDDASTDSTAKIIQEYADKYPDIIKPIFETENQYSKFDGSLLRIMNEHTHGKYVAFCEGDDYWIDPLKLQKQVDYLEKHLDVSLVFSNRVIENELTGTKYTLYYKKKYYTSSDLLGGEILGLQTICFRRKCLISDTSINGDIKIPYNSSLYGKLYCLPYTTAVYRISGKGVATSRAADQIFSISLQHMWNFHETYNFPSMRLLIKAQTRYVFADLISRIRKNDYNVAASAKKMLSYYNQSSFLRLYAFVFMNVYIIYFLVKSIYEKFKR